MNPISVRLIAPPLYVMTCNTLDQVLSLVHPHTSFPTAVTASSPLRVRCLETPRMMKRSSTPTCSWREILKVRWHVC